MTEGDLETGRYRTAYGTDVAPVISHARERGFKRILVLTDGEFFVGSSLAALVEEAGLEITFVVPARACAQHLRPIAKHVFSLEGG